MLLKPTFIVISPTDCSVLPKLLFNAVREINILITSLFYILFTYAIRFSSCWCWKSSCDVLFCYLIKLLICDSYESIGRIWENIILFEIKRIPLFETIFNNSSESGRVQRQWWYLYESLGLTRLFKILNQSNLVNYFVFLVSYWLFFNI